MSKKEKYWKTTKLIGITLFLLLPTLSFLVYGAVRSMDISFFAFSLVTPLLLLPVILSLHALSKVWYEHI